VWRLRFAPDARAEPFHAQDWYECEAAGLGRRFRTEVDRTVQRMVAKPLQFPLVLKTLRRAPVNEFPYMLFFCIDGDFFVLTATPSSSSRVFIAGGTRCTGKGGSDQAARRRNIRHRRYR
jgi:hypothetical protein